MEAGEPEHLSVHRHHFPPERLSFESRAEKCMDHWGAYVPFVREAVAFRAGGGGGQIDR